MTFPTPHINCIATALPAYEAHQAFVEFQRSMLKDPRKELILDKVLEKGQIERRWSCLEPAADCRSASNDGKVVYAHGRFPSTAERMRLYEIEAPRLAEQAVRSLGADVDPAGITHLVITSCTGFSAPGIDLELVHRCGINRSVERTIIGFMGCYAAINGLKFARHVVRSEPKARVLLVSIELCTLHFQESFDLDKLIPFLLFADGCAAALISAEPNGLALDSFHAALLPEAADQMAWHIGDSGFDMVLSGRIPLSVGQALTQASGDILRGAQPATFDMWAVHPGGRAVLDAVELALNLPGTALEASRKVLRECGNMSSATVLFVLKALLEKRQPGERGCAMSFGPGLTAETMLFTAA